MPKDEKPSSLFERFVAGPKRPKRTEVPVMPKDTLRKLSMTELMRDFDKVAKYYIELAKGDPKPNEKPLEVRAFEQWAKDGTVPEEYLEEALGRDYNTRSVSTAGYEWNVDYPEPEPKHSRVVLREAKYDIANNNRQLRSMWWSGFIAGWGVGLVLSLLVIVLVSSWG